MSDLWNIKTAEQRVFELEEENDRLREALEKIASPGQLPKKDVWAMQAIARNALKETTQREYRLNPRDVDALKETS